MNLDSQSAAPKPRSALVRKSSPLISVAELSGLAGGFRDLFLFLSAHKTRFFAYTLITILTVGLLWTQLEYRDWSLSRQVDRSSIVLVEVETTPIDFTRPWKRLDPYSVQGTGSIIEGHYILTAAHVVDAAVSIYVTRADHSDSYGARVHAVSYELDLAVLTVDNPRFFEGAEPLGLEDLWRESSDLVAYGFPYRDFEMEHEVGRFANVHRSPYSISDLSNLKYTIGIAGRPGYSGGPLTLNGRMTGMLIEGDEAQEIGFAVPSQVVRHFLKDIEDGRVDGTAALIGAWQRMENPQIRAYYGLDFDETGVMVKSVLKPDSGQPRLRRGDIILAIDGCNVQNDGTVAFDPQWRVSFQYLVDRKQVGDTVSVELLRNHRQVTVDVPLTGANKTHMRLAPYLYDKMPSYLVAGGFVFSTLTGNYTHDFDSDAVTYRTWVRQVQLAETFRTPDESRDEAIVLVRLLNDATTDGYSDCFAHVVSQVDGRPIRNMRDLAAAFDDNGRAYHRIVLQPDDKEIILSRKVLGDRQQAILDEYQIPADRSPDLAVAPAGP
jgi:S1-C subfamily serine protease